MKKWFLIGLVGVCALSAWAEVSNLMLSQREGTKLVDISYDLSHTDADDVVVLVVLVVSNGSSVVACPSVTGDVGVGVAVGPNKLMVWDTGADWNGQAADLSLSVFVLPRYLVIDLSGGTNATSYPVSYLDAVPSGGWTDAHKTTKLVLRCIPSGSFTMGSPSHELGHRDNETQHHVTLTEDFYMGVFELTQRQWELVMGNKPSNDKSDKYPVERVSYNYIRGSSAGAGWPANGNVDATSFMGKLRQRTGLAELDLPTEAQWEYACRAGTIRAYNDQTKNGGEGSGCLTTGSGTDAHLEPLGVYRINNLGHEANVGTKQANAWGLYDMHGNVFEWCLDWYGTYPGTVTDPTGAISSVYRIYRGGSRNNYARNCRSAFRYSNTSSYGNGNVGFRVCSAPLVSE